MPCATLLIAFLGLTPVAHVTAQQSSPLEPGARDRANRVQRERRLEHHCRRRRRGCVTRYWEARVRCAKRIQLLACAAVLLTTGCGSDTLEPSEMPDVTGIWDLSMESPAGLSHKCFVRGLTVELSQSPGTLEGFWDLAGTTERGEAGCSVPPSYSPELAGTTILLKPGRLVMGFVASDDLEGKGRWVLDLEIAVDDVERRFEASCVGFARRRSEFTGSGDMFIEPGGSVLILNCTLSRV